MEFNSIVRQTRLKNYLNNLKVTKFENNIVDTAAALTKVYKLVLQLSGHVPGRIVVMDTA